MRSSKLLAPAALCAAILLIACAEEPNSSDQATATVADSPQPPAGSGVEALDRDSHLLDPAETAQLLADPAQAVDGVWSVLANLGIGVYTGDADQVLAGSETGPDDFWLYDFEVPILAQMALAQPEPFSTYHLFLSQFEPELTVEALAAAYADAYASHSEAWQVRLLDALGVKFGVEAEITPFVQWLLFVDAFVPPNGSAQTRSGGNALHLAGLAAGPDRQDEICDQINAVATSPAWGAASTVDDLIGMVRSGAEFSGGAAVYFSPVNLAHALMMSALVDTTLTVSSNQVHQPHSDGPFLQTPSSIEIEATAKFLLDVDKLARCGLLVGLGFEIPDAGPMKGMQIQWQFDSAFAERGDFRTDDGDAYQNTFTDEQGSQLITYLADPEPADGDGNLHHENAWIRATFRIQSADLFNGWAAVQEFFFPRTMGAVVDIGWHEASWLLTMTYEMRDGGDLAAVTWDGLFVVDEDDHLQGTGTGVVLVHSNQVGCAGPGGKVTDYDSEVTFSFEIGGVRRPRVAGTGNEFELQISGTGHQATTSLSNSECEIDPENLFNLFFIELAEDPNTFAVGEFILGREQVGQVTQNNTVLGNPILVSVEAAGTGE